MTLMIVNLLGHTTPMVEKLLGHRTLMNADKTPMTAVANFLVEAAEERAI